MLSSHTIGLQLRKMKMYLISFIGAYMENHGKIQSKHRLLSKKSFFSTGDQSYDKKSCHLFYGSLQVQKAQYKFSFLIPVKLQSYRFLATPSRTSFKICLISKSLIIDSVTSYKNTFPKLKV